MANEPAIVPVLPGSSAPAAPVPSAAPAAASTNPTPPPAVEPPAAAAPATPPVVEPTPTPPVEPPEGLEADFGKIAAEFEAEDIGEPLAKIEPPEPAAVVPPKVEEPPAIEPPTALTPPVVPPVVPPVDPASKEALEEAAKAKAAADALSTPPVTEPVKSTEPPKVEPPVGPTPEQVAADRKILTDQWAEKYKITEEEGVELIDKPHEVLPQAMAKLHVGVLEDLVTTLSTLLPGIVAKELNAVETRTKDKVAFYKAWPKLDDPKHRTTVERMGALHAQNNPGMPKEQFIQEVGATAMIALRIPPDEVVPPGATPPAVPPVAPFIPAHPGGGTPPKAPEAEKNMFETMSVEFEQEDG